MDKKTIFIKTGKGEKEAAELSGDLKRAMSLIDNKSTVDELNRRAPPSLREDLYDVLEELVAGEYIRDKDKPLVEPKIAAPKVTPPKMFVPKPVPPSPPPSSEELDFTSIAEAASASNAAGLAAKKKAEEAARGRAELEAAVAEAKAKAKAEAEAKAGAKARQEAEIAARARAEAEALAKHEAAVRQQAEAKAKQEAAARMQAEQVAARAKAELEAAARAKIEAEARVRAEIEAAARAKQEAEAKAKREAEAARLKAEQEAARVKAELEAAARAKAEAEAARLKAEQEAERIRAEAEAARIKAEQEAERARLELAAAKARAEAEAKALAEARAKQEAEEKARREAEAARLKAEQEAAAAHLKAEQEAAAHAKAEAEAKIKRETEEKARQEAEAARLRAEQETARIKAEQESDAKARAVAAAKNEADEQAKRAEREAQHVAAEELATPEAPPAFEINLNNFLGNEAVPSTQTAPHAVEPTEDETKARREAEQRSAAEAKAEADRKSKENIVAEMARMKAEAEEARKKAEEETRRKTEEQALAEEQEKAWAEAEQRAQAQAKIEAEQSAQQAALSQAKAAQKPVSRTRRAPLPLGKIIFSLVALALVILLVLPYVYPLQEYVAPLEQRLSAQLKQPVRIAGMSAASLPPKLQLKSVTVGDAQEVKVGSVVLNFDFLSLLSDIKVVSNAELQDISIDGRTLDRQMASLKSLAGDAQYPIRNLTLQRVKIATDEIALPFFSGIAEIDTKGGFSRVSLHSPDDKYSIDLHSKQDRWQLDLSLKEASLPFLPGIVFSDLNAKGDLGDGEINFTEMDGHLYNGILLGSAKLNWRKGWQLQGRLEAKTFELNKMFPNYGVEGELFGEGTFSLTGAKISQLGDAPRLDTSFAAKKGVINGIDMVETARLGSRENMAGGRTHFDDVIGLVQLENHTIHFRQVKIISGMLSANGSFNVSPDKQLSGDFTAEIKMRAGNNQLTLFGSLGETKLRAGR